MLILDREFHKNLILRMMEIRGFEEEVKRFYNEGVIHGTLHLCFGEEAVNAASTIVLKKQDYIFATHRNHGFCIGKGTAMDTMMAEILGRSGGTNFGRGGSMHICDRENGIIGSNGVVGANGPVACGAALTIKLKHIKDCVSVCFTGDGAANTGAMMEAMNLAGLWNLPVIFVLVENHYAVSTLVERGSANTDFTKRAEIFNMGCFETDGNDAVSVAKTMYEAREYVLTNHKPCLVVEHTYRVSGHSRSDQNKYRTEEEIRYWDERGPIIRYKEQLISEGIFTETEIEELQDLADQAVKKAVDFALELPPADDSLEHLIQSVYAEQGGNEE